MVLLDKANAAAEALFAPRYVNSSAPAKAERSIRFFALRRSTGSTGIDPLRSGYARRQQKGEKVDALFPVPVSL